MISNCHQAEVKTELREIKTSKGPKIRCFYICSECDKICVPLNDGPIPRRRKKE